MFNSLDMLTGYWNIRLDDRVQKVTTFFCKVEYVCFVVMPLGRRIELPAFKFNAAVLFPDLSFETLYSTNIVIKSRSWEEQMKQVRIVLGRLRTVGLKLQMKKGELGRAETAMLGHAVSAERVCVGLDKLSAIVNAPCPATKMEVWSFLSEISYFRRLVERHSIVAAPLHNLVKPREDFKRDSGARNAFMTLKKAIINPLLLILLYMKKSFVVPPNASKYQVRSLLTYNE